MKLSLHHPQHFSVAGLKAHRPCWGKEREMQAAEAKEETAGGSRRAEAQDKGLTDKAGQTSAASSPWRKGPCFSTAALCCQALRVTVFMRTVGRGPQAEHWCHSHPTSTGTQTNLPSPGLPGVPTVSWLWLCS
ncbi:hypothetical protein Cadr_000006215 [Camelus dromedarius]|uniref:Uncharacterized protein n=1 Tax=Camelus dromedarius TaxID=9838 RepID=A0A5N4E1L7_CAMDR|nr:hypothetical protein Cadr_000006215 [Camelus dromedarius]